MEPHHEQQVDVLIVGAGFGGIGQAYALRNLGLSIKVIDSLPDLGGTWLTNTYPGALSDTESFVYRFSWDKEDLQTYPWNCRYLRQPEILAYLRHFAEKHDLRKDMEFNTEMQSAIWDGESHVWEIKISTGQTFRARYFITAMGALSKANLPSIPGISTFEGIVAHTSNWPNDLDVTNKRVGVLGCGASGVQVITSIAPSVASLTAFIRHPQYTLPSNDRLITPEYRAWANENYDRVWEELKGSLVGFGYVESNRPFFSVDPSRRQQLLEDLWNNGNGMRFMVEHFCDITTNEKANEVVCDFLRKKIYQTVKDPKKARKLIPNEIFARRPISNDGYYETYNRENVSIVDLKETPIAGITSNGLRTEDGTVHELDVLVLATGFDAVEGNLVRVNIVGRGGKELKDAWVNGPKSYLGSFAAGFPNMFMVNGPKGAFGNVVPAVEASVEFITHAIQRAEVAREKNGSQGIVEATQEAEDEWGLACENAAKGNLFNKLTNSWFTGGNIPGKVLGVRAYFGGLGSYRAIGISATKDTWKGFKPLS
jgi:cyclohexanone monooxygenase